MGNQLKIIIAFNKNHDFPTSHSLENFNSERKKKKKTCFKLQSGKISPWEFLFGQALKKYSTLNYSVIKYLITYKVDSTYKVDKWIFSE